MAELLLPKQVTGVRFPSPAPSLAFSSLSVNMPRRWDARLCIPTCCGALERAAATMEDPPEDLCDLLGRIDTAADGTDRISLDHMVRMAGRRSFAPLVILIGLLMLAPGLGDIPGVPSAMGLIVIVVAGQRLAGRQQLWLPDWLLRRSVTADKIRTAVRWTRPIARQFDRIARRRLRIFVGGPSAALTPAACIAIVLATPALEVVPFSANAAGAALTAFGLSWMYEDGLMALLALGFTAAVYGVVIGAFL